MISISMWWGVTDILDLWGWVGLALWVGQASLTVIFSKSVPSLTEVDTPSISPP